MILSFFLVTLVVIVSLVINGHAQDPNPNCVSRGHCISTYPKYPDQHTLCLSANDTKFRCAALAGVFGDADWSFGPDYTRDATMMGGMGVDLNETFTVHYPSYPPVYAQCTANGTVVWEITRELSYLNQSVSGNCSTLFYKSGRILLASFEHACNVLTQVTITTDPNGEPVVEGCRCCNVCNGAPCLPP